jgi:hypothetical protein
MSVPAVAMGLPPPLSRPPHRLVEAPTQRLGRAIARRFTGDDRHTPRHADAVHRLGRYARNRRYHVLHWDTGSNLADRGRLRCVLP